jgi:hypothetical protein
LAAGRSGRSWRLEFPEDADKLALDTLSGTYLMLLRMPHCGVRDRSQAVLAALRDAIALEIGDSEEGIQNFYEYWAKHGGPPPKSQA